MEKVSAISRFAVIEKDNNRLVQDQENRAGGTEQPNQVPNCSPVLFFCMRRCFDIGENNIFLIDRALFD